MSEPEEESLVKIREEFRHAKIALNRAKLISKEFDILFNNVDNLELLKSGAEGFFALVYQELQESMIVYLCKLSDPAIQGKKHNLSAQHFLNIDIVKGSKHFVELDQIYNTKILPARNKITDYRNKYGVHSDYPTVMELNIERPTYNDIMCLLDALEEYFKKIGSYILDTHYIFGGMGELKSGAGYLICLLNKSKNC